MQTPFGNTLSTESPTKESKTNEFQPKTLNPFFQNNCLKFDTSTHEPTPDNSDENDSKMEEEMFDSDINSVQKTYSFKKERVFSNIQNKDLPTLMMGQISYSKTKSLVAFNQKSNISFLIIDEEKQENFLQKAIRTKNQIINSCSFFNNPSPSLLVYSVFAGPVKIFDCEAQKTLMSYDLNADLVKGFSTNISFLSNKENKTTFGVFDIRFSKQVCKIDLKEAKKESLFYGIAYQGNNVLLSNDMGVFYADVRKSDRFVDINGLWNKEEIMNSEKSEITGNTFNFKKVKQEQFKLSRVEFLGNNRVLICDFGQAVLMLVDITCFRVLVVKHLRNLIYDLSVCLTTESIAVLTTSDFDGIRRIDVFDFELKQKKEFCLEKIKYNSIGFFGLNNGLLINDSENFSVFQLK